MKSILASAAALLFVSMSAALAADAEGEIKSINTEKLTITLDNGEEFKLPGEFDVSVLHQGMEVLVAYDQVGGEKLITDMQLPE